MKVTAWSMSRCPAIDKPTVTAPATLPLFESIIDSTRQFSPARSEGTVVPGITSEVAALIAGISESLGR